MTEVAEELKYSDYLKIDFDKRNKELFSENNKLKLYAAAPNLEKLFKLKPHKCKRQSGWYQ